jgi:hypothetical protein
MCKHMFWKTSAARCETHDDIGLHTCGPTVTNEQARLRYKQYPRRRRRPPPHHPATTTTTIFFMAQNAPWCTYAPVPSSASASVTAAKKGDGASLVSAVRNFLHQLLRQRDGCAVVHLTLHGNRGTVKQDF